VAPQKEENQKLFLRGVAVYSLLFLPKGKNKGGQREKENF